MKSLFLMNRIVLIAAMILGAASCVTGRTFTDLESERDELLEIRSSLDQIGGSPGVDVMDSEIGIITYSYTLPGATWEHRDTLEGAPAAWTWLRTWQSNGPRGEGHVLLPGDILRCEGSAIQDGTYEIEVGAQPDSLELRQYRAQWVPAGEGEWALRRLWLDPDLSTRAGQIAEGCVSLRDLDLARNRIRLTVEGIWSHMPASPAVADAMIANQWNGENYPRESSGPVAVALGVEYRFTPEWGVRAGYIGKRGTEVSGLTASRRPTLTMDDQVASVLGLFDFGVFQVGVGPAIAAIDYVWDPGMPGLAHAPDPESSEEQLFGAVGQFSVMVPMGLRIRPYVAARFEYWPDAEIPPYMDLESFSVPFSRVSLGGGLALVF